MRHVVFGTAGHIDHGKTTLVKALTGIDCDRLPEEQARGITIDLGFAQLTDGDMQIHFVDVPGHERLVHTMIAGAAGIDLVILVIAADESIMPQTREHLDVIRLMGVAGGAVALTKIDLVDADLVELAAAEIGEFLADTSFADAPVLPVSAHTGQGIDELRRALVEQGARVRPRQIDGRPYRQAVDRVFSLTGVGTVVTGTSLWGRLDVGSELFIHPLEETARVRRLHVHGSERSQVEAGERVAINLVGVAKEQLERGAQLMAPGPWRATRLVTTRLEMLGTAPSALDEGEAVEVHALAARVNARIERLSQRPLAPGGRAVAQLGLEAPMLLFPGDRLILRRPAPVNTIAGGEVLDPHLRRIRRRDVALLDQAPLPRRDSWPDTLSHWIADAGLAGPSLDDLGGRLGVTPEVLEVPLGRLLTERVIRSLPTQPPRFVSEGAVDGLCRNAKEELKRRLSGHEVSAGVPARDFIASLLPRAAHGLAAHYLDELQRRGIIDLSEGRALPPGRDRHMTEAGAELTRRVESAYREAGLDPPPPAEVASALQARPAMVEGICKFLVQRGVLVRLEGKYLVHRAALDEIVRGVQAWEVETFPVADFKDRFGLTRKLAIPILEWLDSQRVTVRQGNERKLLRPRRETDKRVSDA
jgi:selenocysteine-specific elongation factor